MMAPFIRLIRTESGMTSAEVSVMLALAVVIIVTAAMTLSRNYCP